MDLGLTVHLTDRCMDVRELAVEAEARDFSSIWIPEHSHIPVARQTPIPAGGQDFMDDYPRSPDPFVSLTAAAGLTEKIRLCTGVSLVAQHHPLNLAKTVASLDRISGGRFTFGIGYGWNVEEMENHGVDYRSRRERVREHVLAMKSLWAEETAAFHGEFVNFDPVWSWPKPLQIGGPPVYIGGSAGPKLFAAVAEYADGWIPMGGSGLKMSLTKLVAACEARGRDPEEVKVVPFGTFPDQGKLDYFSEIGIEEAVLRLPSGPRNVILPVLDEYADFISNGDVHLK